MARYEYVNETSYKTPIPYHFTCNYCGATTLIDDEVLIDSNSLLTIDRATRYLDTYISGV